MGLSLGRISSRQQRTLPMSLHIDIEGTSSGSADQRTIGSADQRISGSADQRISGSSDQRIGGSADRRISGSSDQRISGSADQRISGSADQRISGSADQRISGSAGQRISGSADRRISGSADRRIGGSADQRIRQPHDHKSNQTTPSELQIWLNQKLFPSNIFKPQHHNQSTALSHYLQISPTSRSLHRYSSGQAWSHWQWLQSPVQHRVRCGSTSMARIRCRLKQARHGG